MNILFFSVNHFIHFYNTSPREQGVGYQIGNTGRKNLYHFSSNNSLSLRYFICHIDQSMDSELFSLSCKHSWNWAQDLPLRICPKVASYL